MTHKLWVTSWRSLWRRTTCWWPIRSASTCMRVPASSSFPPSSRTCALLEHPSLPSLALQTLALCPPQTKIGMRGGINQITILQGLKPCVMSRVHHQWHTCKLPREYWKFQICHAWQETFGIHRLRWNPGENLRRWRWISLLKMQFWGLWKEELVTSSAYLI